VITGGNVVPLVGGGVPSGETPVEQIFHPAALSDQSEVQWMSVVGVTPTGPALPEYTSPFTSILSKELSVLKETTVMGPNACPGEITQSVFGPYELGKLGLVTQLSILLQGPVTCQLPPPKSEIAAVGSAVGGNVQAIVGAPVGTAVGENAGAPVGATVAPGPST